MAFDPISYNLAKKAGGITWEEVKAKLEDTTNKNVDIRRLQLEYPTEDVTFAYLAAINKVDLVEAAIGAIQCVTVDSFADKAVKVSIAALASAGIGRYVDKNNFYLNRADPAASTNDHMLTIISGGSLSNLGSESVDLDSRSTYLLMLSISGSTLKSFRSDMTTAKITATDTSFASGPFGVGDNYYNYGGGFASLAAKLLAPSSPAPKPKSIVEVELIGSGTEEDPYRPNLKQELSKHDKFGNIDKLSVTWGAFDHKEQHNTMLITITGGNAYTGDKAIEKQIEHAKRKNLKVLKPPRDYHEAVRQYKELRKEFPEWIAGKENYIYQCGFDIEPLAVADFYYGELLEHKTHYKQLKRVPEWEMERTIKRWRDLHKHVKAPREEVEKHAKKLDEVIRVGW